MRRLAIFLSLAMCAPACSAIGDPGSFPESFPHGGTGQFRVLEDDEVGFDSPVPGRALAVRDTALDGAMVAGGHLFYTGATLRADAMPPPAGFPPNEVFWEAFEPRVIRRADPREDKGFEGGDVIFEASETWEGADVFDPWVVVEGDLVRMYYAAEGGIGVAESDAIDGTFTRVAGPIVEGRRPSVVRGPDGAWWMYYDGGRAIFAMRSEDGIEFSYVDGDPDTVGVDPIAPYVTRQNVRAAAGALESPELFVGHPAALSIETAADRALVRLYYSSWRADGTVLVFVAGSSDGIAFERHPLPVVDVLDARFPAPVQLDDRTTLLYINMPFAMAAQVRTLVATVSPAAVSFLPPEEE
jgi:hypothetical protein